MDEENFFENLTIGIWNIEPDGISYRIDTISENFIPNNLIGYLRDYDGVKIWDTVIHISKKTWMNESRLNDLMTAFCIKRRQLKIDGENYNSEKIDVNTLTVAYQILANGS